MQNSKTQITEITARVEMKGTSRDTQDLCENEEQYGYLWNAITIPIMVILQVVLLIHGMIHHYAAYKRNTNQSTKHSILYLTMVILGLYYLLNELFRLVVDPHSPRIQHTILCAITAYTPRILPYLFYFIYIFQILFRIEAAFRDSYLAISKDILNIITVLLCMEGIVLSPFCLLMDPGVSSCVATWKAWNDSDNVTHFCSVHLSAFSNYMVIVGVSIIGIHNIALTVVFAYKLRKILAHTMDKKIGLEFRGLIFKNTLLTLFGLISTIVAYGLFIVTRQSAAIFLDVVVNSSIIGLMFQYNEPRYKLLCHPCIALCLEPRAKHLRVQSLSATASPTTELPNIVPVDS